MKVIDSVFVAGAGVPEPSQEEPTLQKKSKARLHFRESSNDIQIRIVSTEYPIIWSERGPEIFTNDSARYLPSAPEAGREDVSDSAAVKANFEGARPGRIMIM
ncbi:hypothetical protein EVAR_36314_1 [Eumeta japonica]|uniref:Uncharacterized protein n=1 Tax=Eumeta variegata TaxID=151549 RepID=A0A4C1VIZ0_EUMVA|nr:hypothetical protein EVAR_36314_1 [Eumeta japonica]